MLELLLSQCAFCNNEDISSLEKSFKFKTSADCGHQVCLSCFNGNVFRDKKTVPCPTCKVPMKKAQLKDESKEEIEYDKEVRIRHEVMSDFNLESEDFPTNEDFHAYQELATTIVWNRLHGLEPEWTKEKVAWNQKEHRAKIAQRQALRAEAERRFQEEEEVEAERKLEEYQDLIEREREEQELRQLEREEGIEVILGERKRTTAGQLRAKRRREEQEARERAAVQQGYGPQEVKYEHSAVLWTQQQLMAQPRADKRRTVAATEPFGELGAADLRQARRQAGGATVATAHKRTAQLLRDGLLA